MTWTSRPSSSTTSSSRARSSASCWSRLAASSRGQAADGVEALRADRRARSPTWCSWTSRCPGSPGSKSRERLIDGGRGCSPALRSCSSRRSTSTPIDAFQVNAVDYLLKPVDPERLDQAVAAGAAAARARTSRAGGDGGRDERALANAELERLVKRLRRAGPARTAGGQGRRAVLPGRGRRRDFRVAGRRSRSRSYGHRVHGTSNYRTLDDLQAQLDPAIFWRVHRSYLVNINKIKEIVPWFSRNYILRMSDAKSTEIPVSRSQTKRLREYLQL